MKVFDGHCDSILRCYQKGGTMRKTAGHLDFERMAQNGHSAQFFACFWKPEKTPRRPCRTAFLEQVALFQTELEKNADLIVQCRTADEIEAAWKAGKQAAILSCEGAELLDCGHDQLEEAYRLGVRAVNLTWNHANALSGTNVENPDRGLTDKGRAFVGRMQELGMLIDVSHLSDPGFWDVVDLAKKPFFASHSNSRAICPHTRNLTDEQFTAIIEKNGVAGLNMYPLFLGKDPDIDTVVRHIERWFALGGEDNVSLGGDWDGIGSTPRGIAGVQDLNRLAERLLQLNYPEDRVDGVFYKNLMRVVREVCTM